MKHKLELLIGLKLSDRPDKWKIGKEETMKPNEAKRNLSIKKKRLDEPSFRTRENGLK